MNEFVKTARISLSLIFIDAFFKKAIYKLIFWFAFFYKSALAPSEPALPANPAGL